MALIDDVAQHLHNQGIASLGTTLFQSYMPDKGGDTENYDNLVAVYDTGGLLPDPYLPTKEPTFQIMIRNTSYATGKSKLDAVRTALHQQQNVQLVPNGTFFYFILAQSEGGHLGRDESGRDLFSINFRCRTR